MLYFKEEPVMALEAKLARQINWRKYLFPIPIIPVYKGLFGVILNLFATTLPTFMSSFIEKHLLVFQILTLPIYLFIHSPERPCWFREPAREVLPVLLTWSVHLPLTFSRTPMVCRIRNIIELPN